MSALPALPSLVPAFYLLQPHPTNLASGSARGQRPLLHTVPQLSISQSAATATVARCWGKDKGKHQGLAYPTPACMVPDFPTTSCWLV